ncbi:MAG: dethiobiotin synthase [Fuerstiella sp.]|nr:dethiobiotin synthase [Fuerstiella sp.]MCP4509917.1 dethiobiotin synthase [Fuerstiella sp.]MCP4785565.1 dethiobiotin synthase [Fuerstiella sp.]MCP4853628.1 dethiobiotin synthase [Fuerstiella sp.]
MHKLFVTGTDTSVGKSWVASLILRQLRRDKLRTGAYKPVCSGVEFKADGTRVWPDVEALANAIDWTGEIEAVCPQRFAAPVVPNVAAGLEGRKVSDSLLRTGLRRWENIADYVVIEGAGGLLCPLSDRTSVADLAAALQTPLVIVAANRLGVINHTLLSVEVARSRGLKTAAVVLNCCNAPGDVIDPSLKTNQNQLQHWLPEVPIFECRHAAQQLIHQSTVDTVELLKLFGT